MKIRFQPIVFREDHISWLHEKRRQQRLREEAEEQSPHTAEDEHYAARWHALSMFLGDDLTARLQAKCRELGKDPMTVIENLANHVAESEVI
jgi:hypothetical protein